MINNQKVVAIIPVRGGSKGIPRKALYRLGKDTLLERAIKLGKVCSYIDHIVVSTDDIEMYEIARQYKVNSPSLRPPHLASDNANTIDVVLYVIEELKITDSYILLLQATSPLRTIQDLNSLFEMFVKNDTGADAIVSLTEHDHPHPDKIQKIENGYVVSYLGYEAMVPRQLLPKVYRLNGAFYLTHTEILLKERTFIPRRTLPFLMPVERSINLDSMMDLYIIETLAQRGIVSIEEYE